MSGKTAANAAVEAGRQSPALSSAAKKRKTKPVGTSTEQAQKRGKRRKIEGAAAEDISANEATPELAKVGSTKRGRPPRPPAEGGATPADQGHKLQLQLGSTSKASLLVTHIMLHKHYKVVWGIGS